MNWNDGKTRMFGMVFATGLVAVQSTTALAANVAHEGFDVPSTVTTILTDAGHTVAALTKVDVEAGALLAGGYDVFVISRNSTGCGYGTTAYADAVADFIAASGNVVTEWSGGGLFFSGFSGTYCFNDPQISTFSGTLRGGDSINVPIDLLSPGHPVFAGLSDPLTDSYGTEFFFWIENPDPRLEVLGEITGTGGAFPDGEQLPVVLSGCSGGSRFVFGFHDWNDTLGSSAVSGTFLTNAVAYAAGGCAACSPTPEDGCIAGAKAALQIKDSSDDTKDQLKWKITQAGAFDQAALGDPTASRKYSLCVYDQSADAPVLAASLQVEPAADWTSKDPKGFGYKDKTGSRDGVVKALLKTGADGKAGVSLMARGENVPLPAPFDATAMFDQDSSVIVQLVNDESATCWTSEFTTATRNEAERFQAKVP